MVNKKVLLTCIL